MNVVHISDKSYLEHPVSGCYYDTLHNRVYLKGSGANHMSPIVRPL